MCVMPKLPELKAVGGSSGQSVAGRLLRTAVSCSHIVLPPGHRRFPIPARAPHDRTQIQTPGHERRWSKNLAIVRSGSVKARLSRGFPHGWSYHLRTRRLAL